MLNQPSQTPPCSVPNVNMFTAAAIAANSSKTSNSDSFSFSNNNNNNNLNKKYNLNLQDSSLQSNASANLQPSSTENGLESQLDQTLFYGSNGSTPLNKSTTLQSSLVKPHQTTPEFSASLANNYANFGPNSNVYNWQSSGKKRILITISLSLNSFLACL